MFVRLSKNTFVRFIDEKAYIINQMTRHDRIYNETGADFLREISREPQNVDDIVTKLSVIYGASVDYDELKDDFVDFIEDLSDHLFLVTGENIDDLNKQDVEFSYKLDNPKTLVRSFRQESKQSVSSDSQSFIIEATQIKPQLNGLQFELTSRCNERCIHCYIPNDKKNAGEDMPTQKVLSLIDEFYEMGGLAVTLSGGEVFMHKDIIKIIQYCRTKDMQISILSNLIALKDVQIPFIKAANVSIIQTSLYSMNPEIHDYITTIKGSHAKTVAAIEKLIAADIPVQLSCPVMKANLHCYKDVLNYAKSLKCKAQTDFIMMAQADLNTQNLANRIDLTETEELIKDIIQYDKDYQDWVLTLNPISNKIKSDPERFANETMCGAGNNDCCITENGDVYPCAGWQGMVVGNVYKDSLRNIWETSAKLSEIRSVRQKDFQKCLGCEARDYCSPCLVRNYNESNGDMFKINQHFCDVAFLTKRLVEEFKASRKA